MSKFLLHEVKAKKSEFSLLNQVQC